MSKEKGITLIILIITIIIMLILIALSIRIVLSEDGLIYKARESKFKKEMSDYYEEVRTYVSQVVDSSTREIPYVNAGEHSTNPNANIDDIITNLDENYRNKIEIENSEFEYVPLDNSKRVQQEVKWCFEIGIKVKGYTTPEEYEIEVAEVPKGEYTLVNGVYVNEPDLTGFNKTKTYYVTYDSNGENETTGSNIISEKPANWYDYQNKIWANVVTISDGKMAYWVWIPRYAYKITYYTNSGLTTLSENNAVTQYGTIDVKFISKNNVYKDYIAGTETTYTPETLTAEGYILPETFTWDGTPLAGYWVSKYEISDVMKIAKLANGDISITNIDGSNNGTYEYYLDGVLQDTVTGLYTYTNLEFGRTYEIKVKKVTGTNTTETMGIRRVTTTVRADNIPTSNPSLVGFNNTFAYYVTYDSSGENEIVGDRITFDANGNPTNIPTGWYDYQNKIWANIVTSNEELTVADKANMTATTKDIAYWVWIPRYEYKIIDTSTESDYVEGDTILNQFVSINFIDTSVVSPTTEGYIIPETFSWDGNPIPGYWVSKYEVSAGSQYVE